MFYSASIINGETRIVQGGKKNYRHASTGAGPPHRTFCVVIFLFFMTLFRSHEPCFIAATGKEQAHQDPFQSLDTWIAVLLEKLLE